MARASEKCWLCIQQQLVPFPVTFESICRWMVFFIRREVCSPFHISVHYLMSFKHSYSGKSFIWILMFLSFSFFNFIFQTGCTKKGQEKASFALCSMRLIKLSLFSIRRAHVNMPINSFANGNQSVTVSVTMFIGIQFGFTVLDVRLGDKKAPCG